MKTEPTDTFGLVVTSSALLEDMLAYAHSTHTHTHPPGRYMVPGAAPAALLPGCGGGTGPGCLPLPCHHHGESQKTLAQSSAWALLLCVQTFPGCFLCITLTIGNLRRLLTHLTEYICKKMSSEIWMESVNFPSSTCNGWSWHAFDCTPSAECLADVMFREHF